MAEHLLLALLQQEDSLIPPLLQKIGVNLNSLTEDLKRELERRGKVTGASGDVSMSPTAASEPR